MVHPKLRRHKSQVQDQTKRKQSGNQSSSLSAYPLWIQCDQLLATIKPMFATLTSLIIMDHTCKGWAKISPSFFDLLFSGVLSQNKNKDKQNRNQTRTASVGWRKGLKMGHTCFYLIKYLIVGDGVTTVDVCIHQHSPRCTFNNCILWHSLKNSK